VNKISAIAVVASVLLGGSGAVLGESGTGTVTGYISSYTGSTEVFLVATSDVTGTHAVCNNTGRFVVSPAHPAYKTILATLLAAYTTGSPVIVVGAGTCNTFPNNAEDIAYIVGGTIAH